MDKDPLLLHVNEFHVKQTKSETKCENEQILHVTVQHNELRQ